MRLTNAAIICLIITWFNTYAYSLEMVSPTEGQTFNAGDEFTVIVKPAENEDWKTVILGFVDMSYSYITKDYRGRVSIQRDAEGPVSINVSAVDDAGNYVKLTREIIVKLPPDVVLNDVVVVDDLMVLLKMLPDSDPAESEKFESRQIKVYGLYSDGVKRYLTSSASGTTYTSSNEKIVAVTPEGKITAQGIGKAKITVRNGKRSVDVDIIVKPFKK